MSKTYEVYPTTSYIPSKEEIEKLAEKYLNTFLEKANIKEEYKKSWKLLIQLLGFLIRIMLIEKIYVWLIQSMIYIN